MKREQRGGCEETFPEFGEFKTVFVSLQPLWCLMGRLGFRGDCLIMFIRF